MIHKRSILLIENEQIIFRNDNNKVNGNDIIERDIFKALLGLEKCKMINLKKLFNIFKAYFGLNIFDYIDITKEMINNTGEWKIITNNEYEEFIKNKE